MPGPHHRFSVERPAATAPASYHTADWPRPTGSCGDRPYRIGTSAETGGWFHGEANSLVVLGSYGGRFHCSPATSTSTKSLFVAVAYSGSTTKRNRPIDPATPPRTRKLSPRPAQSAPSFCENGRSLFETA